MSREFLLRLLSSILLLPLVFLIIVYGSLYFNLFIILCLFVSCYEWHKMSINKTYYIYGIIFLFFSFYSAYKLINYNENNIYFLIVILICISTDVGGYLFGKLIKGPKLTKISPKKTYAGLLGGYFLSLISIYYFLSNIIIQNNKDFLTVKFAVLIIIISSVSQIGDIIISYFKRLSKIKDTGKIIPGHGGLLDRIDGMIFAIPFSYILLSTNFLNIL